MKGTLRAKPGRPNYWELRADAGADPVTKRRRQISRGFRGTRKEAEKALRQLCNEIDAGRHRGTDESFSAVLEAWYASRVSSWSPTTAERNRGLLDLHILPALGSKSLSKLRPSDLDRLYDRLSNEGQAPGSIRKVHAILRSSLNLAERWEWIDRNPAARASPPVVRQTEVKAPPADMVHAVMAEAARYPGFPLFLRLAGVTGARRGELCGLRRSDVDLAGRRLRISRGVIVVADETEAARDRTIVRVGEGLFVKTPKTSEGRSVDLDEETVLELAAHLEHIRSRAEAQGIELVADPYLFSEPMRSKRLDGSQPWHPREVSRKWRSVRDAVGGEGRLHSLRHFVATELLGAGVPLPTVSRRLGHRRTSTTSDIYAAYLPASDRDAADVMGDRLRRRPAAASAVTGTDAGAPLA